MGLEVYRLLRMSIRCGIFNSFTSVTAPATIHSQPDSHCLVEAQESSAVLTKTHPNLSWTQWDCKFCLEADDWVQFQFISARKCHGNSQWLAPPLLAQILRSLWLLRGSCSHSHFFSPPFLAFFPLLFTTLMNYCCLRSKPPGKRDCEEQAGKREEDQWLLSRLPAKGLSTPCRVVVSMHCDLPTILLGCMLFIQVRNQM